MSRLRGLVAIVLALAMGCAGNSTYTPPAEPVCGNGIREGDEQCDDGNTINGDGCNALCQWEGICGNGRLELNEQCDGTQLAGMTCEKLGFAGGTLGCTSSCTFDISGCFVGTSDCGNGVVEKGEQCDGTNLDGHTCEDFGYAGGTLKCDETCRFDFSYCSSDVPGTCGNGIREGSEECDGTDFGGATCATYGYQEGSLSCTQACEIDPSGCSTCGNGVREGGEECDGTDFGHLTCIDFGYTSGTLACTGSCTINTDGCSSEPISCDVFTQQGCPHGFRCVGGDTCMPPGTGTEGDTCLDSGDCAAGYECRNINGLSLCYRVCHDGDLDSDANDCISSEGSRCVYQPQNASYAYCSVGCDLRTSDPCPQGMVCDVFYSVTREDDGVYPFADCYEPQPCGDEYCDRGETCISDYYDNTMCVSWCRVGYGDCAADERCMELGWSDNNGEHTLVIDGIHWGLCL